MMKLVALFAVAVVAGTALTAGSRSADACSCLGFVPWTLTLVEVSPGVDRAAWAFENTFLNRSSDTLHSLHSPGNYDLSLEVK